MHKFYPIGVALLAACGSENELRYTATLQAETHGVVLADDGLDAYAAMSGTTCTIDVNWGCLVADEDLPTEGEALVDQQGEVTLGVSAEGLHVLVDGRWSEAEDVAVEGLRTGRLARGGPVLLGGSPEACWVAQGELRGEAPGAACDEGADHAVDRATGTLFVAAEREVWALAAGSPARRLGRADLIAWDARGEQLFAASDGGRQVEALGPDGAVGWTADTRGPIRDLAARGERGEVLVLVERDDGLGSVERRDGESGRLLGRSVLPSAEGRLVVSRNGVRVGVVRSGEVGFFALETDGEPLVVDPTPPECTTFEFASGRPMFD